VSDVPRAAAVALAFLLTGCTTLEGYRHFRLGGAALEQGDVPRAIVELELAARLVPERSEVQNHLGIAYVAAGRPYEALAAFERAVALDCDNAEAQENLAAARARPDGR
jgi:Flp pilus assembly protein TadD